MRLRVVAAALLCAVGVLAAGCGATKPQAAKPPKLASYVDPGTALTGKPAPNFTLVDQNGQAVSLSQFRGKVVALAFVDSQCTTICPLTTESMQLALRMLGPAAARVQLLGVNANPEALSVADVAQYTQVHGLTRDWYFLTGSLAQMQTVWRNYGIYVQIVKGAIDHTPALYVIDAAGKERTIFLTSMNYAGVGQEAYVLARAIARLLPGHIAVRPLGAPPTLSTKHTITMPQFGGGTVSLSPSSPHVVVFFASWAPGVAAQLAALSAYGSGQSGVPPLTAIDVENTEPSLSAVQAALEPVAGKIAFPVALDKNGTVAEAFGAQDIPWFVLTGAGGKILWHHDGWLTATQLRSDVAAALAAHQQ